MECPGGQPRRGPYGSVSRQSGDAGSSGHRPGVGCARRSNATGHCGSAEPRSGIGVVVGRTPRHHAHGCGPAPCDPGGVRSCDDGKGGSCPNVSNGFGRLRRSGPLGAPAPARVGKAGRRAWKRARGRRVGLCATWANRNPWPRPWRTMGRSRPQLRLACMLIGRVAINQLNT